MAIRNHTCISGITIGSSEHSILLYADDIIIFSSNLKRSIPALLNLVEMFGKFSGYKIYNSKSVLLFLHNPYTRNTITVWFEALAHLGELTQLSRFSPVFGNENFRPGRADPGFKTWSIQGINKVSDLNNEGNFMFFEEIRTMFGIPQETLFQIFAIT